MTENKDALPLDWLKIAKLAGEHGVRYQTNARLEAFLADLSIKPPIQDAMRETVIGVIRDKLSSFDYPVSAYEREFADAIMAALSAPNVAGERAFPEAADGRPLFPMADELYMCGADADTANFVARMLAQNGYRLIGPEEPLSTHQSESVEGLDAACEAFMSRIVVDGNGGLEFLEEALSEAFTAMPAGAALAEAIEALEAAERLYRDGILATPNAQIERAHEMRRKVLAKHGVGR